MLWISIGVFYRRYPAIKGNGTALWQGFCTLLLNDEIMTTPRDLALVLAFLLSIVQALAQETHRFDKDRDLLLSHFDCKTDVDDIHSAAALATLMSHPDYKDVEYHAVAGTYGMQNGLYVPPNSLFELAFGKRWSDAHENRDQALAETTQLVLKTLDTGGDIWIADAGQSDFSAALVRKIKVLRPELNTAEKIHVVQHSNWNEQVTTKEDLSYVKAETSYHKIPDGNAVGNGTPGFRTEEAIDPGRYLTSKKILKVWEHAIELGNTYNGAENRYYNKSIGEGGLDFSDMSEVCYILGLENLKDAKAFFAFLGTP